MSNQKHFTVSIFIVCKDKVLLHSHKKYGILLPIGGHLETNELPEEACIREAREETGLEIDLYNADIGSPFTNDFEESNVKFIVRPMHMIYGQADSDHYHIDFNYYATTNSYQVNLLEDESNLIYWYTKEELNQIENIPRNVMVMANEALDLLSTK
jgi:ADP-ribose pyrophosphatase YjhB (NUDIX family)